MLKLRVSKIRLFELFFWIYYIWYYFPLARTFFRSGVYNQLFFAIFACGIALCAVDVVLHSPMIQLKYSALLPVLAYFAVFTVMVFFDVETASRHIRISFTFWGTLIVYYFTSVYPEVQKRLATLVLVMFLVTTVTSLVGVINNPSAARTLAYAANDIQEDLAIRMMNIGGIEFFQGLVICVPILISFVYRRKYRVLSIILTVLILAALLSASFTIALIMFFVALALSYLANQTTVKKYLVISVLLIALLVIPWSALLSQLASAISNEKVSERLQSIATALSTGYIGGDLKSRLQVYMVSLETFLKNPFGLGPYYTYVTMQNGIGYHSQVLDDLARYGIFAIAFYAAFFVGYYQLLREQWRKIRMEQIVLPVILIYFAFLVLNPGFTSAHEGVLILFLIPAVPSLFESEYREESSDGLT